MFESSRHARFRALYEDNYARILGYALRRTVSAEDAADVVADTFTTAWRRFDEMPGAPALSCAASTRPCIDEATLWLYGVARRTLANHRRKVASRSAVIEMLAREYEEAVWFDPPPSLGAKSPLTDAWRALRPDDRDLLGLITWEGLTTEQIAAVIGCPRSAAKVRIHRARRRLAKELERRDVVKPSSAGRHVQVGRAEALPDTEAI
jgi:RNA polymerase sigma factor (sigma-70 family)